MSLSALHLPRPRRLRLPDRLLGGIPGLGKDTWTADDRSGATAPLSLFDPVYLGADLYGDPVSVTLAYRNLLCGGVPDSGKSNGAAQVIAHAALCPDVRMWFLDGKWVELGFWQPLAERFVGPVLPDAIDTLTELCGRLDERYEWLLSTGRRKLTPAESAGWDLVVVDELSLYTATYGTPAEQKEFSRLLRDIVSRGRAACMPVVASAQRPSSDVVPTSLRDLFAYRWAFRCTTPASSDVVLYDGLATAGYDASQLDPDAAGVGYLLAHGGVPLRIKSAYLPDDDIATIVRAGLHVRGSR
jgi:DNA segregation ATPase FtsK/SpoIIIE, S-DNA-T family